MSLLIVIMTPLLLALAWCVPALRTPVCRAAPWAAVPALVLALAGDGEALWLDWMLLGTVLGLDETTRVFLAFTALLWLGAGIHARGYLAEDPARERFFLLWLMTMAGNLGLILALDVVSFYLFFALMTFAAYGLVIHTGEAEARRAGRVYLVMAVIGEGLIIAGLLMAASQLATPLQPLLADLPATIATAAQRDLIIGCLLAGFGIKAGLPLLHMWLPLAHPVAPVPASAVLSGAMIKAGLLGWMNTLPLGVANLEQWGTLVIVAGFVAAFAAALIGVNQRTPKTVLAYSSISQMGLITVAIGAGLHSPLLWPALVPVVALYALHHGLAKGALFLGVGIAQHPGPRVSAGLWLLLALPALSLAGIGASGVTAKLALKGTLYEATQVPAWWSALPLLLACAAIGTTVLVARYLFLLHGQSDGTRANRAVWAGWALVLVASTLAVVMPAGLLWGGTWAGRWPGGVGEVFDLLWPVALGVTLALAARRWLEPLPVPAGDVLNPLEAVLRAIGRAARMIGGILAARTENLASRLRAGLDRVNRDSGRTRHIEHGWRREAALVLAALLVVLIVLLQT